MLFLFFLQGCLSFRITTTYVTVNGQSVDENVNDVANRSETTVSMLIGSTDGILGFDTTRAIEFTTEMVNDNNQFVEATVKVKYSDPLDEYQKFFLGYIPQFTFTISQNVCETLETVIERLDHFRNLTTDVETEFVQPGRRLLQANEDLAAENEYFTNEDLSFTAQDFARENDRATSLYSEAVQESEMGLDRVSRELTAQVEWNERVSSQITLESRLGATFPMKRIAIVN